MKRKVLHLNYALIRHFSTWLLSVEVILWKHFKFITYQLTARRFIFGQMILLLLLHSGILSTASAQEQMQVKKNDYTSITSGITQIRYPDISEELLNATPDAYYTHPDFGILPINAPDSVIEYIHQRTTDSRYYVKKNTNGNKFYIQKSYGPINYYDPSGYLRAIDYYLHPTMVKGIYEAASQPAPTKIDFVNQFTEIRIKDLDFRYNANLTLYYQDGTTFSSTQTANLTQHTAGRDGVWVTNAFKGVDVEIAFRQNAIKTNFIINDKSIIDPNSEYLIIDDPVELPEGFTIVQEDEDGYLLKNGDWKGDIVIKNQFGLNYIRIERPVVLDQNKEKTHAQDQVDAVGFQLVKTETGYIIRLRVSTKWLLAAERKYPVVIDPTLIGEATYTAGDIGFEFDGLCWNEADYCNYFLDITVPGKTTLTDAYFDGTYYSQNFGCFFVTDCLMSEAAFRILGICDDSPAPGSFWTCSPPVGDSAGTCYGVDLNMFNTIACIPPQCADYEFTFEMRTWHCSCTQPPCGILCHFMPSGSWVITIEGETVVETAIQSSNYPDFVICEGDTIDLNAGGYWGVPPYTYEWLPGGAVEPIHSVSPTTTSTYTSVIHDFCDMTDTVTQEVIVNPSPIVNIGPFEACYQTTITAPAGYTNYVWTDSDSLLLGTGNSLFVDSTGVYYVTVIDGNGCEGTSAPIIVNIYEAPIINAIPDTVFVNDGALAYLEAEIISGDDVSFFWTPSDYVNCPNCPGSLAFTEGETFVFYVTGEENGCVSLPDSIVVVMEESELIIPNAFTPNEDGLNDEFNILNPIFYPEFSFRIYNRWGQEVFATSDVLKGWDGTYDDESQEIGMYVWVITYEKANDPGKQYILRGTVTLLR